MYHNKILIRGAKEHNLKNVDVTLPRFKLGVITGVALVLLLPQSVPNQEEIAR